MPAHSLSATTARKEFPSTFKPKPSRNQQRNNAAFGVTLKRLADPMLRGCLAALKLALLLPLSPIMLLMWLSYFLTPAASQVRLEPATPTTSSSERAKVLALGEKFDPPSVGAVFA